MKSTDRHYDSFLFVCTHLGVMADHNLYKFLKRVYNQPHRHYHNWKHICHYLDVFKKFLDKFVENDDIMDFSIDHIEYALFFHDIVYELFSKYNETLSAQMACTYLDPNYSQSKPKLITNLILSTHHSESIKDILPNDDSTRLIADIDLAIFGENTKKFEEYTYGIREEYHSIPDEVYNPIRKKFLTYILERYPGQQIYHTDMFRDMYTERAVENLLRAIEKL